MNSNNPSTRTSDQKTNALAKLHESLNAEVQFPANVFRGLWDNFLFFDSDMIFDAEFIKEIASLSTGESSDCVCMCNVSEAQRIRSFMQASIFLYKETTNTQYLAMLRGSDAGVGWLYRMDRYALISESGNWCIYCERNNEIAVLAVRNRNAVENLDAVIKNVRATSIKHVDKHSAIYGLSNRALSDKWRTTFIQEYAARL